MSMDEYGIRGTATTYKGNIVKYVRVFEWTTGTLKEIIRPSLIGGAWEYNPSFNIDVGLTYISDNEQPYTNGPYTVEGKYGDVVMQGYLLIAYISYPGVPSYDITDKSQPTWSTRFEHVQDIGLFNYKRGSGSIPMLSKTINMFSVFWNMQVTGSNGSEGIDSHTWTLEFLSADDTVLCAVKSDYGSTYSSNLFYGRNLESMTQAGRNGTYTATGGNITFTPTQLIFTNTRSSQFNKSFTYEFDVSSVKKVRVGGSARVGSYGAGGHILLVPPE